MKRTALNDNQSSETDCLMKVNPYEFDFVSHKLLETFFATIDLDIDNHFDNHFDNHCDALKFILTDDYFSQQFILFCIIHISGLSKNHMDFHEIILKDIH